jgi:hypothetical protein
VSDTTAHRTPPLAPASADTTNSPELKVPSLEHNVGNRTLTGAFRSLRSNNALSFLVPAEAFTKSFWVQLQGPQRLMIQTFAGFLRR